MNDRAIDIFNSLGGDSLIVNISGQTVILHGNTRDTFNVASIRKCFLSALYGMRIEEGVIKLSATLDELGIDDNSPGLTRSEKQATIEDLLTLRSGVYHPANYETSSAKESRPSRGAHPHGIYWYYNNWDANVLGTIYRNVTGNSIFNDFKRFIADQIGMQDLDLDNCEYKEPDENSMHRAYIFRMTSRDLLRFVDLYLLQGNWGGKQLIPHDWVERSLKPYSVTPGGNGFGYMWEVDIDGKLYGVDVGRGSFSYSGYPGHYIVGIPTIGMSMVYSHSYDVPGKETVPPDKFSQLLQHIVGLVR